MNTKQKNFYFYFREQVLKENFMETDDFYVMLFATELSVNFRGFSIEKTHKILSKLYTNYGNDHPNTAAPIYEDLLSLSIKYNLPSEPLFSSPFGLIQDKGKTNYLINQSLKIENSKMGLNMVLPLLNIDLGKSKLAKENQMELYTCSLLVAVNYLDSYFQEYEQQRFFDAFSSPKKETYQLPIFEDSLFQEGEEITLPLLNYYENTELRHILTEIARYTENEIRQIFSIRGRLRNIDLAPEIMEIVSDIVQTYVEREIFQINDMFEEELGFDLEGMDQEQSAQLLQALESLNPEEFDESATIEDIIFAIGQEMEKNKLPQGKTTSKKPPSKGNIIYPDFRGKG